MTPFERVVAVFGVAVGLLFGAQSYAIYAQYTEIVRLRFENEIQFNDLAFYEKQLEESRTMGPEDFDDEDIEKVCGVEI